MNETTFGDTTRASSPPARFEQVVCVDQTGLTAQGLEELQRLSRRQIIQFADRPTSDSELITRLSSADCVLVSWNTHIGADVLRALPRLRYVGMCCSLYDERSANVDIPTARELGIAVRGIRDYGDEGVVEFIFGQLIYLLKGLGAHQWKEEPEELFGKKLGILGFGTTGQMVARTAQHFGMQV